MNLKLLAANIRTECRNQNILVRDMLQKLNINKNTIANIDNGTYPSISTVYAIAEYLNVSIDALTGLMISGTTNRADMLTYISTLSDDELSAVYNVIQTVKGA